MTTLTYVLMNIYVLVYSNNHFRECGIDDKKVYMIEPLIGIRACTDTFFCQKRNYNDTLDLMNLVVRDQE